MHVRTMDHHGVYFLRSLSVMFCILINVDILLLFLTIFIRYKTEMHDDRQTVDAIYIYLFKFIYRSYGYKLD